MYFPFQRRSEMLAEARRRGLRGYSRLKNEELEDYLRNREPYVPPRDPGLPSTQKYLRTVLREDLITEDLVRQLAERLADEYEKQYYYDESGHAGYYAVWRIVCNYFVRGEIHNERYTHDYDGCDFSDHNSLVTLDLMRTLEADGARLRG